MSYLNHDIAKYYWWEGLGRAGQLKAMGELCETDVKITLNLPSELFFSSIILFLKQTKIKTKLCMLSMDLSYVRHAVINSLSCVRQDN